MFKVTKINENRLDIEMSGSLNSDEMRKALDELVLKSADIQNGTMRYDVIDFQLPSLSAIVIEFSRLPSMIGLLNKFNRAAVMTDKTWLKKISELEGKLYPGLEIKAFNRDQVEEAEAWLSGNDDG